MSTPDNLNSLELLRKEVARILHTETPESDVPLAELGIDSLNVVELLLFCDQLYGSIEMDRLDIGQFTTLQSLDEQLRRQAAQRESEAEAVTA
jgi:acyl carrier protein